MQSNSFLLYGANGYTGELIARYAADFGLHPVLAGRSEHGVRTLSDKLGLPYKILGLDDAVALENALREVKLVIHAAGPFQFTARQMADACLRTGTHYLDINGDISVFEMLKGYDVIAQQAGIMLLPGAGFDVVPTDCTALLLKKLLPDAVSLQLAFASLGGGMSHGTAASVVYKLGEGGAVRKNGKIVRTPLGQKGMTVDFGPKKIFVMNIPWGDVSTAHFTTGIPNIEAYTGIAKNVYRVLKFQVLFNWLLRTNFVRNIIKKRIDRRGPGPTDEQRSKASSLVWGRATNAEGRTVDARLRCADGYTLTAHSSLLIAKKVLAGNFKTGYQTPASAYGENLVTEIAGSDWLENPHHT